MKTLYFSYNWNHKLQCQSFSTVRIFSPNKFQLLDDFEIYLRGKKGQAAEKLGVAKLQVVVPFFLDNVTPGITFIDANLPKIDFIKLVKTMYKNYNIDFKKQKMAFMVFQYQNS